MRAHTVQWKPLAGYGKGNMLWRPSFEVCDGLSLIAVYNNKLLDLERKFQSRPPALSQHSQPPFYPCLKKCICLSKTEAGSPHCALSFLSYPPSTFALLAHSLRLPNSSSCDWGPDSGKRLKNLSHEGTHTHIHRQTSTCDKPLPNNRCWLRESRWAEGQR